MKKIIALILCASVLTLSGCNSKSESSNDNNVTNNVSDSVEDSVMQEQIDITRNRSIKLSDIAALCEEIGFIRGGSRILSTFFGDYHFDNALSDDYNDYQGYSYKNTPSSIISIDNYIFYISEDMELHCINAENSLDKVIAEMRTNAENIFYSDSYMIFYGSTDRYNYSHYLYDIKHEKLLDNDLIRNLFSDESGLHFVGIFDDNLCYMDYTEEYRSLKYQNINDNGVTIIYTDSHNENDTDESVNGYITDISNHYLYYETDYNYYDDIADGRIYGQRLFRYDLKNGTTQKVLDVMTANLATNEECDSLPEQIYAINGKLYTFHYQSEIGVFSIENGEIKKVEGTLPGENVCLINNLLYYKSNDSNVIINGDKTVIVDTSINEESGFLGYFDDSYWYSTSNYLKTLNIENKQLEDKVLFNGFIINSGNDSLYCYGKPIEKYEVTDIYGNKSTSYEEEAGGIYKVSINDTETEKEFRDVFFVSDSDKSKAISILDETLGTELLLLVKSPSISANSTTYNEKLVSVVVSGNFRLSKDVWTDGTVVFTVNLSDKTCRASGGSIPWSTIVSAYNNGI